MAFVRISKRLAAQPTLTKADVEAVYRDIIQVLGGWIYSNGTMTGAQNGTLDYRNFAREAGFQNIDKTYSPNAQANFFPVAIRASAPTGTASFRAAFPFGGDGVAPAFLVTTDRWLMSFGNSGPSSGTAKLFLTNPGVAEAQIGLIAGQVWAAANPLSILFNEYAPGLIIKPQASIRLEIAISSGTAKDFVMLLWLRSMHVR